MSTKLKTSKRQEGRLSFRAEEELTSSFQQCIDRGGFCKSAVLRNLLRRWVEEQQASTGDLK